jgi:hypothetical protein
MHHASAVLYCYLCPVRLYRIFPNYLLNVLIFEEKNLLNTKCVFWFSLQLLSKIFFILRRIKRDVIKTCVGLHVKYSLFLLYLDETWSFFTHFQKNPRILIFMKIHLFGVELFYADGWTDIQTDRHDEANSRFSNFFQTSLKACILM